MGIPKIVFQTSSMKPPNYLVNMIKSKCEGWQYFHFIDKEIIQFMKENPIENFENSIEIFNSIKAGQHKADFFRYYFLYVNGGVYIDSDATLEKDLNLIIEDYTFFTVESCVKKKSMFNGFIGAEANNLFIYQALKDIYTLNQELLTNNYFLLCDNLYSFVENYNDIIGFMKIKENPQNIKIFKEKIIDSLSETYNENNETILKHYFNKNVIIPSSLPIKEKKFKNNSDIKIGITFDVPPNIISLFSNGIKQNILYFYELLDNIGYDTYLINTTNTPFNETDEVNNIMNNKLNYSIYTDLYKEDFDIVFIMGYTLTLENIKQLKQNNTKVVKYLCGNSYFINSETVLYNKNKNLQTFDYLTKEYENLITEIWSIPQMVNCNKHYWQTLYRTKCIEVPFIWSNSSIKFAAFTEKIKNENDLLYKFKNENKKIGIFEPNISIMKWCFPALLICENSYRINKEIDKVLLCNINDKSENDSFNLTALNNIVKSLDLFEDKKISIESRYNTLVFMKNHADIAVSHQMENPLNYLYLDLAWMGWPIIHNAHLCKDIGYYYENFDYEMGGKILSEVIKTHDLNHEKYLIKNRELIDRYLPTNKELQEKYKSLIYNLLK